jgi:hypothetical protein
MEYTRASEKARWIADIHRIHDQLAKTSDLGPTAILAIRNDLLAAAEEDYTYRPGQVSDETFNRLALAHPRHKTTEWFRFKEEWVAALETFLVRYDKIAERNRHCSIRTVDHRLSDAGFGFTFEFASHGDFLSKDDHDELSAAAREFMEATGYVVPWHFDLEPSSSPRWPRP